MPSPFPGMDPYLERADLWPEVHALLMTEFLAALKPLLRPRYTARLDSRVTLESAQIMPDVAVLQPPRWPDAPRPQQTTVPAITPPTLELEDEVPVRRTSLEIWTRADERLVTIIELLSPVNKSPYDERYWTKRKRILRSGVHLLEIDLLREGQRVLAYENLPAVPYFVTLRRAQEPPSIQVWAIQLADPLPVVPVPLLNNDPDAPLDLGRALDNVYDRGGYAFEIDYAADPVPPLSGEQAAWADALLRGKGLRPADSSPGPLRSGMGF